MKTFIGALLVSLVAVAARAQAQAPYGPSAKEMQYIAVLNSTNSEIKVLNAIRNLENLYDTDLAATNCIPSLKKLVANDSRSSVRRKAARVLGVMHAPMSDEDVKQMCRMLKASDPAEIVDALKALRGLYVPQAVPDILPLLQNTDEHVVRDSCRTLAVIGNKSVIDSIQPLTTNANPAIRKDAMDAIVALRNK